MSEKKCKHCDIVIKPEWSEWRVYPASTPPDFKQEKTEVCCGEDCAIERREHWFGNDSDAEIVEVCKCGGEFSLSNYCGCHVCTSCSDHVGMERCYCGWSKSGGDGRRELVDMGETIDEDL